MLLQYAYSSQTQAPSQAIVWRPWSDEIFAQAARKHRFVLLDLEAVWCHVMDEQADSSSKWKVPQWNP
jgi:uncharacterized protein YyaL (SSP411 family)